MLLPALCVALVVGGLSMPFGIRRGDLPEPPPPGWPLLGPHPSYRVETAESRDQIDKLCRAAGVSAADEYNKRRLAACVDPAGRVAYLLAPGVLDAEKQKATEDHEFPHTWGLRHKPGGRDWLDANGYPAQPITPEQAAMMRSMAEAEQRLMTRQPAPPPPGLMTSSRRQFGP